MRIELSSTVLRRPEPTDVPRMYQYRNNWEVARSLYGFVPGMSRKDLDEWVEFHRQQRNEIVWVIADKGDDTCLGHVGLYNIDHRVQKADLGLCIGAADRWGKGLGKEIVAAVTTFAFSQLNLHLVRLRVLATNHRAVKLYQSLGFQQDGCLRHDQYRDGQFMDVLVMSILRTEWEARKQ